MFAQVLGMATFGLNGILVTVEVDISNGLPCFDIVGLADIAVREAKERVRAAIKNSGYNFPVRRIIVNLAPANMKKDGSGLDLAIAIGLIKATGETFNAVEEAFWQSSVFIGELSLEGKVRAVNGILPMILSAVEAGCENFFVAKGNAQEALLVSKANVYAIEDLKELVWHITRDNILKLAEKEEITNSEFKMQEDDFSEIQGQEMAKRALEIAAAGGHNILMVGSPGSGKTMLAKRLISIMPKMSEEEALEVTKIYSVAGLVKTGMGLYSERPFRNPHHTISGVSMVGGGRIPKPGEVTLSHNGVLFLDEMPEFNREVLEVLRQPLEDGEVTISRVTASLSYPAKFMLVCSLNPCPCGFRNDEQRDCRCSDGEVRRYQRRISGPLLDRIDICVHVARVEYKDLQSTKINECSEAIRRRVDKAREVQKERLHKYGVFANAHMKHRHVKELCILDVAGEELLRTAYAKLNLSARAYDRILKLSRTIADLAGSKVIAVEHLAEAIQLRGEGNIF